MTDNEQAASDPGPQENAPASASGRDAVSTRRKNGGWLRGVAILLIVLAVILGSALYYQNLQYRRLHADFQQQQAQNRQTVAQVQAQATQALEQVRAQTAQIGDLRGSLETTAGQVQELDQALQLLTDSGSDLLLLNDIDRLVTIAQQQLALGGNVANAIVSLEAAQAQLARANRPNLAGVQQSINGDLDRLRAVATINVPALSGQLDQLSTLIATAPLLVPDAAASAQTTDSARAAPESPSPSATADTGWRGVLDQAWSWTRSTVSLAAQDFRSLFDIRRVDDTAALLMSPDQAFRFREGLKQRAVTAQLALMMHQPKIWQSELERIAQAIDQRYDMHAQGARQALQLARALHDTPVEITLPGVDNSLAAIAAAREAEAADDASAGAADGADSQSDVSPDTGTPQAGHAQETTPAQLRGAAAVAPAPRP